MTHTNNGKQWELVQVPDGAHELRKIGSDWHFLDGNDEPKIIIIPSYGVNYGTPKLASELSESEWAEICKMMPNVGMYKNYMQPIDIFPLANEAKLSGISLLASHNLTLTNCVIIPII